MPSLSPRTGAVKEPVCSHAAEHSKQAASCNHGVEVRHVAKMIKKYRDTPETQQSAHHVALTWSKQLLTLNDAAQYAICSPRYLQKQIRAGRLKALKPTAKFLRIRRAELDRFLESGATIGSEA